MNKIKLITTSIALLILANAITVKASSTSGSLYSSNWFYDNNLKQKGYYDEIFNKAEKKLLKKADKYFDAAEKYMAKYQADQIEIERLYTIAESSNIQKKRVKSLTKARKLESKALQNGFKALDYYKRATEMQFQVYTSALNRSRVNDNSKNSKLGRDLELQARTIYDAARLRQRNAPQDDEQLKFNTMRGANDQIIKALQMQEAAFGVYKNDPAVDPKKILIPDDHGEVDTIVPVITESNFKPNYVEQYNPSSDPNLYRLNTGILLPKLNPGNTERNLITNAFKNNEYGNSLMKKVDEAYMVIDSLQFVADRTTDQRKRDELWSMSQEKELNAFSNLMLATNAYVNANEIFYKIYKDHYPPDTKINGEDAEKIKKYWIEADDYYRMAKNEILQAGKLPSQSDKYLKLMSANDKMLYALQLQESGYALHLGLTDLIAIKSDPSIISGTIIEEKTESVKVENTPSTLSWELLSTYTYSKEKPKPVLYKTQKGVVFLVQLGIFKGILPPEKFKTVQPVVFDKFVKNPYRRFMAGEYQSYEAAELALAKVKAIGYSDALIIALIDGQRTNYANGKAKLNTSTEQYQGQKAKEMAKIKGESITVADNPKIADISGGSVTTTKGLLYFIQLGMFQNPLSNNDLKGLEPIFTEKIAGKGTRYMLGTYATYEAAKNEISKVKNVGFKDAYVTAYIDGGHTSLDRARKIEKTQYGTVSEKVTSTNTTTTSSGKINFMVQVGAYSENLSAADINKLKNRFKREIDHRISGGMNIYTIGNYTNYKEADYLKKKLKDEGHNDVFVVAFDGQQKITVSEAIKRNN